MTTKPDVTAMALALASAKKPCPQPCVKGITAFIPGQGSEGFTKCGTCEGTGEVYMLPNEVRVECTGTWIYQLMGRHYGHNDRCCDGRHWNPLDPRYGWEWMEQQAVAGFEITLKPPTGDYASSVLTWEALQKGKYIGESGQTPDLAWFQAAMKALGLDTDS